MLRFGASIEIYRSVQDVFAFVADGRNAPRWNSAVREVRQASKGPIAVGTHYWMERKLPQGIVENTYEVIEYKPDEKLSIKSISGPTPFLYRYTFEVSDRGTKLSLSGEGEIEGFAKALGPFLNRAVKRGVEDNFRSLKAILESRR